MPQYEHPYCVQCSRLTNQNLFVVFAGGPFIERSFVSHLESREMQKIDEGCECDPEKGENCRLCFMVELSSDSYESASYCLEAASSSQATGRRLSRCTNKCLLCSSIFGTFSELGAHKSPRFCPTCGSHFRCHDQFIMHTRRRHYNMIHCGACSFKCSTIEEMQAHITALTKCVDCGRYFTCACLRGHLCDKDDGDELEHNDADGATGQPQGMRCRTCHFLMDMKASNCPRCLSQR